jgi:hypothetical protein
MNQVGGVIGQLFFFGGPCLIFSSLVSAVRTKKFLDSSFEVNGEVIRLERSATRDRYGYTYAPVFSFTAANGMTYTVTSDISSSPPSFTAGDFVRVRYDPTNPGNARIHSFFQTWGTAAVLGGAGAIFLAVGCNALGFLHL